MRALTGILFDVVRIRAKKKHPYFASPSTTARLLVVVTIHRTTLTYTALNANKVTANCNKHHASRSSKCRYRWQLSHVTMQLVKMLSAGTSSMVGASWSTTIRLCRFQSISGSPHLIPLVRFLPANFVCIRLVTVPVCFAIPTELWMTAGSWHSTNWRCINCICKTTWYIQFLRMTDDIGECCGFNIIRLSYFIWQDPNDLNLLRPLSFCAFCSLSSIPTNAIACSNRTEQEINWIFRINFIQLSM